MKQLYAGPMTLPPFESDYGHNRTRRLPGREDDPHVTNEKDERDEKEKKRRDDDDCIIVPVPCIIIGTGSTQP